MQYSILCVVCIKIYALIKISKLGELVGCGPEERTRSGEGQIVGEEQLEPAEIRFTHILMELGADKLFKE